MGSGEAYGVGEKIRCLIGLVFVNRKAASKDVGRVR